MTTALITGAVIAVAIIASATIAVIAGSIDAVTYAGIVGPLVGGGIAVGTHGVAKGGGSG